MFCCATIYLLFQLKEALKVKTMATPIRVKKFMVCRHLTSDAVIILSSLNSFCIQEHIVDVNKSVLSWLMWGLTQIGPLSPFEPLKRLFEVMYVISAGTQRQNHMELATMFFQEVVPVVPNRYVITAIFHSLHASGYAYQSFR